MINSGLNQISLQNVTKELQWTTKDVIPKNKVWIASGVCLLYLWFITKIFCVILDQCLSSMFSRTLSSKGCLRSWGIYSYALFPCFLSKFELFFFLLQYNLIFSLFYCVYRKHGFVFHFAACYEHIYKTYLSPLGMRPIAMRYVVKRLLW